jgi:hemoglobin-like flavoprotein
MGGGLFVPKNLTWTYIDDLTLTSVQVSAIRKSWELVKSKKLAETVGALAFIGFFAVYPDTLNMFPFSRHSEWKTSKEFNQHCRIVVHILASVVTLLDKPDLMEQRLSELGLKHSFFNILTEHYDSLGVNLIAAFEEVLDKDFTPDARSGWSTLYTICAKNIQKATADFIKENGLENFVSRHVINEVPVHNYVAADKPQA